MTYSTRNSFYLRISKSIVLPIYVSRTDVSSGLPLVYLDERHVDWMTDKVLQYVLSDLRPHILPKLKAEADSLTGSAAVQRKATVDTHRGDSYQFCYFIRKIEPHSVVIKTRHFRAAPKTNDLKPTALSTSSKKRGKRKEPASSDNAKSKKRKFDRPLIDQEGDTAMSGEANASADEAENLTEAASPMIVLEIEEEEEKPKPILGLKYRGFSIYGQCLCVVIEPWPVVRVTTVAPLFAKPASSRTSVPGESNARAQTPLFLPEDEDPEDSQEAPHPEIPHRSNVNLSYLKQVLSEQIDMSSDEDDMGGMLEFSQVLQNIGDTRAGGVNDDDDMDGSVLFGDADESKEL